MERDDRAMVAAPVASFFVAMPFAPGDVIDLDDAVAHHARVKRLERTEVVRLTDGAGNVAFGQIITIDKRAVSVEIDSVRQVPAPRPIHVRVPVGDRDRMLWLAEKVTELGIASWQAVRFKRSASVSPRGEGDAFAVKVRARMLSALEQSGGAWLPAIHDDVAVDALRVDSSQAPLLLDVDGIRIGDAIAGSRDRAPIVLFGPEGGLDGAERERLLEHGWQPVRLANTTLRFETAGIAAVAILRAMI